MMRSLLISLFFLLFHSHLNAQKQYQLAPPLFSFPSVFFSGETSVRLAFAYPGAVIRYTLDGRTPSDSDALYESPLRLTDNITTVTARSFAEGYFPSESVKATFIKQGYPVDEISSQPSPHPKYSGSGAATLKDGKGGVAGRLETWWGFDADTVLLQVTLDSPRAISKVLIHFLQNQGSWIFLPQKVSVSLNETGAPVSFYSPDALKQDNRTQCVPLVLLLDKPIAASTFFLTFLTVNRLPEWHSGKGNHAWMFIDEIEIF